MDLASSNSLLNMFNYSIVIRTLGNTGEKYLQMLQAIDRQTVKPCEVVVVIPEGYRLDYQMGNERIIRSAKGMVTQRAVGISAALGDYLLVLDDDLDFPSDFAEQLYNHLQSHNLDCVLAFGSGNTPGSVIIPQKTSFKTRLKQAGKRMHLAFTGQAFYSHRTSRWFDTIASTGGHRTYVNCEEGFCQTGAFACFFIKTNKAQSVHFEEELWLEQGNLSSYAAYDDAVFFYKLYLQGGKIAYTHSTDYIHLDAAAGRQAKTRIESKRIRLYTIARNRTIFWHRHIWSNKRSFRNLAGGLYGMVNYALYNIVVNLYPKYWSAIGALLKGYSDSFRFIRNK